MYQAISQIPMKDVLDKLGIKYTVLGSSLGLWDGGKLTDGWRDNLKNNYVNDFSCKDRPSGSPFSFVKSYLWLSDKETFDWFIDNFGIENNTRNTNKNKKYFNKKRESMKLPKYYSNW